TLCGSRRAARLGLSLGWRQEARRPRRPSLCQGDLLHRAPIHRRRSPSNGPRQPRAAGGRARILCAELRRAHRRERAAHHGGGEGRHRRARPAGRRDRPRPMRGDGGALLSEPRLYRRPPRLHGKAQARLHGHIIEAEFGGEDVRCEARSLMCSEITSLSAWRYCALRWKRAFGNVIKVAFFSLVAAALLGAPVMAGEVPKQASQIRVSHQAWLGSLRTRATVPLGQAWVGGAAWRSDSKRVAVYLSFGDGFVLDRESGSRVVALPPPESSGSAHDIRYTPDDKFILLTGQALERPKNFSVAMTLVDGETGAIVREIAGLVAPAVSPYPPSNIPEMIAFDPERSEIVTVPSAGLVGLEIFDLASWRVSLRSLNVNSNNKFALRRRSRDIAFIGGRGTVRIMDRLSGEVVKHFQALPADVTSIAYRP